ncbi:hypothetical protein [Actinomadura sp. NEAU-AAG7]|uniref:hypothetical protein n=1 Tax=Actinomadura sp. NEAU-AAG7 TaxID=2839640 RepID=UPI001BE488FD|nr:hypothetical protein [Actinomadura sp. NEAU-AAG7]MBT2213236.1 hypothetical protein [Actinomadura sp. NEAU-AAG7]
MTNETPARAAAGERARATGITAPPAAGDAHVAGPPPKPAGADVEAGRDTAPDLRVPKPTPSGPPAEQSAGQSGRQTGRQTGRPPAEQPDRQPAGLLDPAEAGRFKERWHRVQAGFVDDPAEAVRKADGLAEEITEALARALAEHRRKLSEPLGSGGDGTPDTERLRLALRSYRSLLDHILET